MSEQPSPALLAAEERGALHPSHRCPACGQQFWAAVTCEGTLLARHTPVVVEYLTGEPIIISYYSDLTELILEVWQDKAKDELRTEHTFGSLDDARELATRYGLTTEETTPSGLTAWTR